MEKESRAQGVEYLEVGKVLNKAAGSRDVTNFMANIFS